jgi:hypothetical protein
MPGFEADDIMATMACRLSESDFKVVLVSKDKDLRQMVGDKVIMYDPQGEGKTTTAADIERDCGYPPSKAVEIQTLMGDSIDNVPGIPGVGEKTAAKLIKQYGSVDEIVKHADELSLLGIARAINDLGERARTKKLSPDEVQKGTFTITNPGVFGSAIGTPIINQPQAAILCVGSIEKQPAVITVDGTDMIAIRTKGMLSLAFDHRIVDGADADRFMADVKATLQDFPESAA